MGGGGRKSFICKWLSKNYGPGQAEQGRRQFATMAIQRSNIEYQTRDVLIMAFAVENYAFRQV